MFVQFSIPPSLLDDILVDGVEEEKYEFTLEMDLCDELNDFCVKVFVTF